MNRILPYLYTLVLVLSLLCIFSSCALLFPSDGGTTPGGEGGSSDVHKHSFTVKNESADCLVAGPTCESGSEYYYSCECGEIGTNTFTLDDMLGHTWENATCTEPRTCSECGATQGSSYGHSWKAATCTTAQVCTVCGCKGENSLGHDWVEATCTAAKHCTRCNETEGKPADHEWEAASCTHPEYCDKCGLVRGDVLMHEYDGGVCVHCGKVLGADDGMELPVIPID